jgi:hypothetical protein
MPQFDFAAILLATATNATGMIEFDFDPSGPNPDEIVGWLREYRGEVEAILK